MDNPTAEKHTILSSLVTIFTKNSFSYGEKELSENKNIKLTFKDIVTTSHVWAVSSGKGKVYGTHQELKMQVSRNVRSLGQLDFNLTCFCVYFTLHC